MGNVIAFNFVPDTDIQEDETKEKLHKSKTRGNGEGSVFYNEKKKAWTAQFVAGRKADGSLDRHTVYGKTRELASKKLADALSQVQSQTFNTKSDLTVSNIARMYIEKQFENNLIQEGSYHRKINTLKVLDVLPFSNMRIQKVDIPIINYSLPKLAVYSPSVISKIMGLLNTTFDYAIGMHLIHENPFKYKGIILRPNSNKETKKVEALTIDEQKTFVNALAHSSDIYKKPLLIATFTGMRIGEILALRGEDIDIENHIIHVSRTLTVNKDGKVICGKTTKTYAGTRDVPFIPALEDTFKELPSKGFLFKNQNGNFISHEIINSHFIRICTNAGIRINFSKATWRHKLHDVKVAQVNTHMLRHTFATRCIEAHMDAVTLSRILGHTDIKTTLNTYTSVFNQLKIDEMEKANKYFENMMT